MAARQLIYYNTAERVFDESDGSFGNNPLNKNFRQKEMIVFLT